MTVFRLLAGIYLMLVLAMPMPAHADVKGILDSVVNSNLGQGSDSALSEETIAAGLKDALTVGVDRAVALLGQTGGFLDDPEVRIPLPDTLQSAEKALRAAGQGAIADEFVQTMNRAAEQAVPETVSIFSDTIGGMTLDDAKQILNGPDDAATQYFRSRNEAKLNEAIRPIVQDATERTGATAAYKRMTAGTGGLLSQLGMGDNLDLDTYVTDEAMNGLFLKLAEEEKRIREDPLARSTDLLKAVFAN
jgi:hypothetical protein